MQSSNSALLVHSAHFFHSPIQPVMCCVPNCESDSCLWLVVSHILPWSDLCGWLGAKYQATPFLPTPHTQTTSMTILSLFLSVLLFATVVFFQREIQALYIFPRASQSGHPPLLENSARTKLMNVQTGTGTGPRGCETWQADEDATTTTAAAAQPPPSSQPNNFLHWKHLAAPNNRLWMLLQQMLGAGGAVGERMGGCWLFWVLGALTV